MESRSAEVEAAALVPVAVHPMSDHFPLIPQAWGLALVMETVLDDPIFILLALAIRTYFPLLLCYELVFKNRAALFCCWPITQAYDAIAFGLGGLLGLV